MSSSLSRGPIHFFFYIPPILLTPGVVPFSIRISPEGNMSNGDDKSKLAHQQTYRYITTHMHDTRTYAYMHALILNNLSVIDWVWSAENEGIFIQIIISGTLIPDF